jgi:protein ImuA
MRIAHALSEQAVLPQSPVRRWKSGIESLDAALAGGLAYGRVHEVYAGEADDASAAAAFVVALATSMSDGNGSIVWLRSHRSIRRGGSLQANGWAELGGEPANALFGVLPDNMALLRAAVDALRCAALDAVIVEAWGRMSELDLTASRRLTLAAEKSGVPLFLLRVDAAPVTSAAQTRWQVASAPSRALAGQAPGWPTFDIELLRQKSGPSGLNWRLEWNRDRHEFRDASASGAVVPVPVRRPAADSGAGALHPIARRAA